MHLIEFINYYQRLLFKSPNSLIGRATCWINFYQDAQFTNRFKLRNVLSYNSNSHKINNERKYQTTACFLTKLHNITCHLADAFILTVDYISRKHGSNSSSLTTTLQAARKLVPRKPKSMLKNPKTAKYTKMTRDEM